MSAGTSPAPFFAPAGKGNDERPIGLRLHPDDVEAIAQRVAALTRPAMADHSPEFTREESAAFLRISVREFDRERGRHADQLKPARATRPLLWRKSTLEVYRALRGGVNLRKAS